MFSIISKALRYAANTVREQLTRFAEWQRNGTPPRPMTHERHECLNCNHVYEGNFCPRCGQSSGTSRFTFKHAMSKTLEVWGLGNRSMPRTLLHLVFRPGYMIGDYLKGKHAPFFPPVKMLFLVTAANVLIVNFVIPGLHEKTYEEQKFSIQKLETESDDEDMAYEEKTLILESINNFAIGINKVLDFFKKNQALELIFRHSIFAFFTMLAFRKSPKHPKQNITECFFAQILIASQLMLLSALIICVSGGHRWSSNMYGMPFVVLYLILFYDYKQLYGQHWLRTALNTALVFAGWFATMVVLVIGSMIASVFVTAFNS